MSFMTTLKCVSCRQTYGPDEVEYTCPICGQLMGTLEVLYDYDAIRGIFSRDSLSRDSRQDHWRYLPLLPVSDATLIPSLSVGMTPLYDCKEVAVSLELGSLCVKDDGRNPTASLKDRASSVALIKARERGCKTVTAASTGNAASSWAAFARLADLEAIIFVPENAPRAKIAQLLLYGATVLQVRGSYDDAFDLCCQASRTWGWFNRSTAINPYLGEGKKTAAIELCEQLQWQPPDYVFVSVGDGCIFQGMWKGFKELHRLGLIDRCPKMVGVQAEGSAPLVAAWQSGAATALPIKARTIADSISVGVPRDQVKALKAVRESEGRFLAVSDDEILAAVPLLARKAGVLAEPAGAASMAGVVKMAAEGLLKNNDSVAVIVSGNGLKDIDGIMKAVDCQPIPVDKDLNAVERELNSR